MGSAIQRTVMVVIALVSAGCAHHNPKLLHSTGTRGGEAPLLVVIQSPGLTPPGDQSDRLLFIVWRDHRVWRQGPNGVYLQLLITDIEYDQLLRLVDAVEKEKWEDETMVTADAARCYFVVQGATKTWYRVASMPQERGSALAVLYDYLERMNVSHAQSFPYDGDVLVGWVLP